MACRPERCSDLRGVLRAPVLSAAAAAARFQRSAWESRAPAACLLVRPSSPATRAPADSARGGYAAGRPWTESTNTATLSIDPPLPRSDPFLLRRNPTAQRHAERRSGCCPVAPAHIPRERFYSFGSLSTHWLLGFRPLHLLTAPVHASPSSSRQAAGASCSALFCPAESS